MSEHGNTGGMAAGPSPSFRLETLKKRRQFRDAATGQRFSTPAFTLLRRPASPDLSEAGVRFGFTVTRKVGNSVERNRIRRRLREAVRAAAPEFPSMAMDLVILARRAAIDLPFGELTGDIARAVRALSTRDGSKPRKAAAAKNPAGT